MATKRPHPELEEPALFDLPLHQAAEKEVRVAAPRRAPRPVEPEALALFPAEGDPPRAAGPVETPRAVEHLESPRVVEPARPPSGSVRPRAVAPAEIEPAGPLPRFVAGLADFAVHLAVGVVMIGGSRLLGVERTPWPPLLVCLTLFSFVYFVVPMAFWGNTPGMAWRGLQARARGGEPLSFGQAARRWLGVLLSASLLGLPVLGALRGRTLTDVLSGSWVRRDP